MSYSLGDTGPGGGKIFYISGSTYLEAAPITWSGGTEDPGRTWATGANQSASVSGADGTAIGTGYQNSVDIAAQSGNVAASCAAVMCREYAGGGKSDWFLPSIDELMQLYANRSYANFPSGISYYSSSEASSTNAHLLWDNGTAWNQGKAGGYRLRPIRTGTDTGGTSARRNYMNNSATMGMR